jgi:pimeloyl-ACP methyl ester carboxylesterase
MARISACIAVCLLIISPLLAESRISLPAKGIVPVAETAGPFPERQTAESLSAAKWIPIVSSPAGVGDEAYYFTEGEVLDLSRRFMPVSGRAYVRLRIEPASDGDRTITIASYNKTTFLLTGGNWQEVKTTGTQSTKDITVSAKKGEPVVILLEVTPLYSSSKLALAWSGADGDVLLIDGDVEQAVLGAVGVEPRKSAIEDAADVQLDVEFTWPRNRLSTADLSIKGPDDAEQTVKWGAPEVQVNMPGRDFSGIALRITLGMGKASREIAVAYKPGIEKEAARLRKLADSIPLDSRKSRALFLLRVDQVEVELAGFRLYSATWKRLLERLEEARSAWEKGEGDFYGTSPGFREDAYVSDVDLTAQPYLLYVSSRPLDKRPLVVYLHGYVPGYCRADWIGPLSMEYVQYEEAGAIYVTPFARSNTDFLTVGETDVLDVIAEMKRRFSIDENRVYVVGYSMGGSGVWTLLAHYPDIWAGALVLSGRTDYYFWQNLDRNELSPWLNAMILADNPVDQPENFAHVPLLVFHGDSDWVVKSPHSTRMVEKLKALGSPVEFYWIRGADHWRAGAILYEDTITQKLLSYRRNLPSKFTTKTWLTKYADWRGITVLAPEDTLSTVSVQADFGARTVKTENALFVSTPPGFTPEGFAKLHETPDSAIWGKGLWAGAEYAPCRSKSPRLPGTFRDLTSHPFAVVYGTKGTRAESLETAARSFAAMWRDFTNCPALVYKDTGLPQGMEKERSLILFGEASENTWTERVAPALPFSIVNGAVTLGKITQKLEPTDGYIITYPSPLACGRYVALCGLVVWGQDLPVNHKWDFVPDIVVFRKNKAGFQGSDEYLRAGFFDGAWRVDEHLIFTGHLKQ